MAREQPDRSGPARGSKRAEQERRRRTRAVQLLAKLLDENHFTEEQLAAELVTTPAMIRAFKEGRFEMPTGRQMYIAVLALQHVPTLASEAHRLRGQLVAAARYEERMAERR